MRKDGLFAVRDSVGGKKKKDSKPVFWGCFLLLLFFDFLFVFPKPRTMGRLQLLATYRLHLTALNTGTASLPIASQGHMVL